MSRKNRDTGRDSGGTLSSKLFKTLRSYQRRKISCKVEGMVESCPPVMDHAASVPLSQVASSGRQRASQWSLNAGGAMWAWNKLGVMRRKGLRAGGKASAPPLLPSRVGEVEEDKNTADRTENHNRPLIAMRRDGCWWRHPASSARPL